MELTTERLLLRDLTPDDLDDAHAFGSDPEVSRYMPWGPNSLADTRQFLDACLAEQRQTPRTGHTLAVVCDAAVIGVVSLTVQVGAASGPPHRGELGYSFNRGHWGRGYATEAAGALLHWAFDTAGLHRVEATCRPANPASAHVLEKLGMRREGHLRDHMMIHGSPQDSYLYAVLRTDR